jgi:hypothetical protein
VGWLVDLDDALEGAAGLRGFSFQLIDSLFGL